MKMNDPLQNDLPTEAESCITDLEATLLTSELFHGKLRRSVRTIKDHAKNCAACNARIERANSNLERDRTKLTQLLSTGGALSKGDSATQENAQAQPTDQFNDSSTVLNLGFWRMGSASSNDDDYAVRSLSTQLQDKKLVADYVADRLSIPDGAGLFVDAGSQNFLAYNAIAGCANREDRKQLHLVTSNMLVLASWISDQSKARKRFPTIQIAGGEFDAAHQAFYGLSENKGFESFRPSLVLIGASGFEVEPGRLWLGTHAGDHEIRDKERLFKCPAKKRVILLTPGKIGEAGSKPLDILGIKCEGPIYIVTASPREERDQHNYQKAIQAMRSPLMLQKLNHQRIRIHWVTVNGIDGQKVQYQEEIFPSEKECNVGSIDADVRIRA